MKFLLQIEPEHDGYHIYRTEYETGFKDDVLGFAIQHFLVIVGALQNIEIQFELSKVFRLVQKHRNKSKYHLIYENISDKFMI